MKNFLFFIGFLIVVLLQVSFRLPNLTLGFLILFLSFGSLGYSSFVLVFLFGLCLDLTYGGWWGLSSAFFLSMALFLFLYQQRFFARSLAFIGLFTFFSSLVYDFVIQGRFYLGNSLVLVLLVLVVHTLLNYFLVGSRGLRIDLRERQ